MAARRYTILIADRTSGVVRRITISARPAVAVACAMATLPVLVGIGAAWKARSDVTGLYANQQALEIENASYRNATQELSGQIQSIQSAIADLGARAAFDPSLARTMDKLPALVKARAMGGTAAATGPVSATTAKQDSSYARTLTALSNPDDTFGLLRTLLEGLESRLQSVRTNVEKRNALAAATPSIWPTQGWLTSTMGPRTDPLNGGPDYHPGLDIAGEKGQPIYATAAGLVTQAGFAGGYGNLIILDHGFGLETRYGHLSQFLVHIGDRVKRGEMIGRIGNTGKTTGPHLHYEVMANGRLLNPLQLLTQQKTRAQ
ncbi:MAG TPA: M23 family metallopeptidase [Vicinamibacterales bacterium]|nr:M23 family metallopeptidase [Vicinamibacterales bacterium]